MGNLPIKKRALFPASLFWVRILSNTSAKLKPLKEFLDLVLPHHDSFRKDLKDTYASGCWNDPIAASSLLAKFDTTVNTQIGRPASEMMGPLLWEPGNLLL